MWHDKLFPYGLIFSGARKHKRNGKFYTPEELAKASGGEMKQAVLNRSGVPLIDPQTKKPFFYYKDEARWDLTSLGLVGA